MTPAIDHLKPVVWLVGLVIYTVLVVLATLKMTSPEAAGGSQLAMQLKEAHEEEISRLLELQEKELADRDRILEEYSSDIETIRSDYWDSVSQIEQQIRAQKGDIVNRIYEDPDAAAQILVEKYGLVYAH